MTFLHRILSEHLPDAVVGAILATLRLEFGGSRAYVPAEPDARRLEALGMLKSGRSVAEVAHKLKVHESTVYRWWHARKRAEGKAEIRQTGLSNRSDWYL